MRPARPASTGQAGRMGLPEVSHHGHPRGSTLSTPRRDYGHLALPGAPREGPRDATGAASRVDQNDQNKRAPLAGKIGRVGPDRSEAIKARLEMQTQQLRQILNHQGEES